MADRNLPEAVMTGEASQLIKDAVQEKAKDIEKKVTEPSNEEKFLSSPEGQRFVDDVTFLRDVYDASRLQGKSDEELVAYIEKRYPEDVADLANQDQDTGDAWLMNKIEGIKAVWEQYPDLANSNKYVIDRVKTKDKNGKEYFEPRYVPMTNENKMLPKTTGQFIQSVATEASLDDFPMNAFPLRQAIAKNMAMQWYPSKTNEMPMLASFIAPRSGDMWYDDEARTKAGGIKKALIGDALEFGLNFVPWTLAEKGAQSALKLGYRGSKAVGANRVAQGLANASKGLSSTMYKFHALGEGANDVGSIVGRGAKGALTNTAQGLAVEGVGDVYDAFAGTDRGKGMIGMGKEGMELDPVNLMVTAGAGGVGKALGNPSKGASARDELWGKINASPDWGAKMLEQRARMGKPWNFASDIDNAWMRQYVDQNGKSTQTFANEAYDALGKNFPNGRVNPDVNVVQKENADIALRNEPIIEQNKVIQLYNDGVDKQIADLVSQKEANRVATPDFVKAIKRSNKTGYPLTAVFRKDNKYHIGMANGNGGYNLAPITDDQAKLLGVNLDAPQKKVDYSKDADVVALEGTKKPLIPTYAPIKDMQLRTPDGDFTKEAKWYFDKNWKNLGYDSYEDCMASPNDELQKWLDMENSHLTDGWDKEFGLGNGEYQPIAQLKHRVNKRAPSKMQSELTESEKIANTTNASEYKLAGNNIELENGTEAQYKTLKDADAEYAMRQNQKMGKYKDPRKSNAWWQLMLRGGRGLVGNYLVPSVGRAGGASDYQFETLPNNNEENFKLKNDSYYDLYKAPKIPTANK